MKMATDFDDIPETEIEPPPPARNGADTKTADLAKRLAGVAFDVANPPPDEPAVLTVAEAEVCHPGNVTAIEAHIKTGKSAFVAAGIASVFAEIGADCLGWKSDGNPDVKAVLHFDTEQSRGDHYRLVMRSLSRAGTNEPPAYLKSYCLTGWSNAEMRQAVEYALERSSIKFNGIHSIWLDGIADFVSSPNDEQEAFALVRWLLDNAINFACPVIGILHLNPGELNQKSRGHLGSELNRKSETVLRLTKDDKAVSTVATKWSRGAPIPNGKVPRFSWCDEHGRHVSVITTGDTNQAAEIAEALKMIRAAWSGAENGLLKYEEMKEEIMRFTGKSEATAKRKIGFIQEMNLVQKMPGGIGCGLTDKGSKLCEPDEPA